MQPNRLYFGDCLEVMQEYISDESVDLIYLDPPFNSKRLYNAFIGGSQYVAFDDTWRWHEAIDDFHSVAGDVSLAPTIEGFRTMLDTGPDLAYLSYMANRLRECKRVLKSSGSIFLHCDPTMSHKLKLIMDAIFGKKNFRNEIVWFYNSGPRGNNFGKRHDIILWYTATRTYTFNKDEVREPYSPNINIPKSKAHYYHPLGKVMGDVWEIPILGQNDRKERVGYPTQKPLALLDRILRASSNSDDIVLDPFCGCGTTVHAAQNLGRRWIGIDICVQACKIIQRRIESHFDILWDDIEFVGMPTTVEDAKILAQYDPFKFEKWAASLTPGMEANKRQRGDAGIDGRGRYPIRKGVFVDVVSQVKAGRAAPTHIQAFNGARQQANADLGVFTCFEEQVTHGMRNAAVNAGRFKEWPRIQIYTVEDYFAERKPDLPLAA